MTILVNCTINSVTGTEILKIRRQPPQVFLKNSQDLRENIYARTSFLIKPQAYTRPVDIFLLTLWIKSLVQSFVAF